MKKWILRKFRNEHGILKFDGIFVWSGKIIYLCIFLMKKKIFLIFEKKLRFPTFLDLKKIKFMKFMNFFMNKYKNSKCCCWWRRLVSGEKGQNTVETKEFIQKYANNSHKNIDSFFRTNQDSNLEYGPLLTCS